MNALLLGGISPISEDEFLYAGKFRGEAGRILGAVGISVVGKTADGVLTEFQRAGLLLTHVLECPLETGLPASREDLLQRRIATVATRIRRSLKPKRVILMSSSLEIVAAKLSSADLGCPVILNGSKPFDLDAGDVSGEPQLLRQALGLAVTAV